MSNVNVDELKKLVASIAEMRTKKAGLNHELEELQEELNRAEFSALEMLKAADLPNFRCNEGLISKSVRLSVKTPKSPEDRAAFFEYLKGKGLFDTMISVNSATLNAFYKTEFELAKERGQDDFRIPGLNEEVAVEILSFRKS